MNGDISFQKTRVQMDSRYKEMEEAIKSRYGPLYNLIYVRSNHQGKVIGHCTLYNVNSYQFVLAERGGTPNKCTGLVSDPENPSKWSDQAADEFSILFDWLEHPEYLLDFRRQKDRLDALMRRYFEVNNPKLIVDVIGRSLAQIGLKPGDAVPPNKAEELSKVITDRVAHHLTDQTYEEKLTAEQMASFFSKK